jgi:hypothetical protein
MSEPQSGETETERDHARARERFHEDLQTEYTKLVDIVSAFDQRLLTIKGWGVTLSLASVGLGFQQDHYGLFLVAAASGLAFWMLEATTKMHQMRYYPRMGDLEYFAYKLFSVPVESGPASSPLIDWAWWLGYERVRPPKPERRKRDAEATPGTDMPEREKRVNEPWPWPYPATERATPPWRFPQVALPHAASFLLGMTLFVLGLAGVFGPI